MAATDILTLPEAFLALRGLGDDVTHDADVTVFVSAISQRMDDLCGAIVARSVTETHDGSTQTLVLNHRPYLSTLTSVNVRQYTTSTAITVSDLVVDASGIVDYPLLGFYGGRRAVTVVYQAGRFADTASVSPIFKLAARLWLQSLWRPAEGGGSETFGVSQIAAALADGVPEQVLGLLGSEVRAPGLA